MLKEVSKWGYRISALFWSRDVRGSSVWGTQLWNAPAPGMKSLLLREAFESLRGLHWLTSSASHLLPFDRPGASLTPPTTSALAPHLPRASTPVPVLFPLPEVSFPLTPKAQVQYSIFFEAFPNYPRYSIPSLSPTQALLLSPPVH